MMFVRLFVLSPILLVSCSCGFWPNVMNIGVLTIGSRCSVPKLTTFWCDDIMLCGKAPLSLRFVSMETTLSCYLEGIRKVWPRDVWIVTTTDNTLELTLRHPVPAYLTSRGARVENFGHQLPAETRYDWCSLAKVWFYPTPLVNTTGHAYLHVEYVLSLINQSAWQSVVIIHDEIREPEVKYLSESLSRNNVMHVVFNPMTPRVRGQKVKGSYWSEFQSSNQEVDLQDYINVIVWCSSDCVKTILREISTEAKDMTSSVAVQHLTRLLFVHESIDQPESTFHYFNQSSTSSETDNQSNVTQQNGMNQSNEAGFSGDQSNAIFSSINQSSSSMASEGSYPLSENEVLQQMEDLLGSVQMFHVAVLWKSEGCVRLQSLLNAVAGSRTLSYAGFGDSRGHVTLISDVFPNTKWRLNGQKLVVATAIWEPFVNFNGTTGQYSGMCIDMLEALAFSLNFTYELVMPEDGQYGSIEDGNWTGLVRMLKDKKADIVVAPIAVNDLRATVVDFTTPFYHDYTGVLFRRPDPALHKWKTYFMPFSWEVFVLIGVSFVLSTAFGHVVGVLGVEFLHGVKVPDTDVMDTVQYFYGSLLAHGGVWSPMTGSARLFVASWWFFCVILAAVYSGNLTASFAVSVYEPGFTTLVDMLKQDSYSFGTVPGTIWIDIFKYSNRSDFRKIEQKMLEFMRTNWHAPINSTDDHVMRALRESYAYVSNVASLTLTLQTNCDLMVLDEKFLPLQYALALQKQSPLTKSVSRWILKMTEGGVDKMWESHWWRTEGQGCEVTTKTRVKVDLLDCQSAFYVLVVGLCVSVLVIVSEVAVHWCLRRMYPDRLQQSVEGRLSGLPASPTRPTAVRRRSVFCRNVTFSSESSQFSSDSSRSLHDRTRPHPYQSRPRQDCWRQAGKNRQADLRSLNEELTVTNNNQISISSGLYDNECPETFPAEMQNGAHHWGLYNSLSDRPRTLEANMNGSQLGRRASRRGRSALLKSLDTCPSSSLCWGGSGFDTDPECYVTTRFRRYKARQKLPSTRKSSLFYVGCQNSCHGDNSGRSNNSRSSDYVHGSNCACFDDDFVDGSDGGSDDTVCNGAMFY